MAELINLVNSFSFFSQTTLLRWLTFLLKYLIMTLTALVFWDLFSTQVFFLQWLSLHWDILIILFLNFHWLFLKLKSGRNFWSHFLCLFLCWLERYWDVIIWVMFQERVSLNPVLLLMLLNFVSGARLVLIDISLTIIIRSSYIHLHDIQLFSLMSRFI